MSTRKTDKKPTSVRDETGRVYELSKPLGTGGQGSVFLCKGGKLAVKLLGRAGGKEVEKLREQIAFIRRLPLGEINVAKPVALLDAETPGYVMEFMSGMQPLAGLCQPPSAEVTRWHLKTGSLRRRLRLLSTFADRLHHLHSRGLVYGDPSPSNVFVSDDPDCEEVWLIDSDNICYSSSPISATYFTPRYGAPEIVCGRSGFTTMSDAFAFGVIAYEMLTLSHPLIGRAVTGGSAEEEIAAFRGEHAWVESTEDDSNHSDFGIRPSDKVLSPRLKDLCEQTFGAGLRDVEQRPSLRQWRDVVGWAEAATLVCGSCGGTHYHSARKCPWCNAGRHAHALVTIVSVLPDVRESREQAIEELGVPKKSIPKNHTQPVGQLAVTAGEERHLSKFHLAAGTPDKETVRVRFDGQAMHISNEDAGEMYVASGKRWKRLPVGKTAIVPMAPRSALVAARCGPLDSRHVALKLTNVVAQK